MEVRGVHTGKHAGLEQAEEKSRGDESAVALDKPLANSDKAKAEHTDR